MRPADDDVLLDPSGAWVELLGSLTGRRVVLVDELGSAAADLLVEAGADVVPAPARGLGAQSRADVVVLAGPAPDAALAQAAARCLAADGVLLAVHANARSPLAALDAARGRTPGTGGSLRSTRRALAAAGLPARQEYALLRSVTSPSTAWALGSPRTAALVLDSSNTLNGGLRRRAVQALRWAAEHRLAPLVVPGLAVLASARPLDPAPPLGRIGYLGSHEAKLLHGDPVRAVEKVYSSSRVAAAEAEALEQVERVWPGLAPRLLDRPGPRRNLVTWTPGRTLPVEALPPAQAERWLAEAAALLGELHRRLGTADDRDVLVHGDYWLGNLLVDDAATRITGIIDWTDTRRGDAGEDLAFLVSSWVRRRGLDAPSADRLRTVVQEAYARGLSPQ